MGTLRRVPWFRERFSKRLSNPLFRTSARLLESAFGRTRIDGGSRTLARRPGTNEISRSQQARTINYMCTYMITINGRGSRINALVLYVSNVWKRNRSVREFRTCFYCWHDTTVTTYGARLELFS